MSTSRTVANASESRPCATLVTGGSRGIGRAIIERLLAEGHRVLNLDRDPPAQQAANEIF